MDSYEKSQITERIFLGSFEGACDTAFLKKEKVTRVVSILSGEFPSYNNIPIKQIKITLDDSPECNIIKHFKECIEFMDENEKDIIFVHCMCGVSRSSTIVIAYLMWKRKSTFNEVYDFVKSKRCWIWPNQGFTSQLKIFEKLLKDNNYDLKKIKFKDVKWPQPY